MEPKIPMTSLGGQSMNLAKEMTRDEVVRPAGFYASIVFDVLIIALAYWFGREGAAFLNGDNITLFFISLLAFSTASVLQMFLTRSFMRRLGILALEGIALLASFWSQVSLDFLAIAWLVTVALWAWGELEARHELENSMSIRFARVSHLHLKKFASAASLLAVLFFVPRLSATPLFISQQSFQNVLDWSAGLVQRIYPDFTFNGSVGDLAKSIVLYEDRQDPNFAGLTPKAQDAAVASQMSQAETGLSQAMGEKLDPQEPASAAIRDYIIRLLQGWQQKAPQAFAIIWAVGMFFVIRSIGSIFNLAAAFIAFVAYQLLLAFNLIQISTESRTHEFVHYSV